MVALRGLAHYRLALLLGLSYADGLSGSAENMDWFVDMIRWVAGLGGGWVILRWIGC